MIKREELLKRRPDFGRESGWNARCALAKPKMVGDRKVSPFARRMKLNKFEKQKKGELFVLTEVLAAFCASLTNSEDESDPRGSVCRTMCAGECD